MKMILIETMIALLGKVVDLAPGFFEPKVHLFIPHLAYDAPTDPLVNRR